MPEARKKEFQLGQQLPRNAGEKLYYDKYGTVTPLPKETLVRKNSIQVCAILYIHQGLNMTEACRVTETSHQYGERIRKSDRWDEFQQELAQLTKPSNLTLVQSHDIGLVSDEHERRSQSLPTLIEKEAELVKALSEFPAGSQAESVALNNLVKVRTLIGEITGYNSFQKEMSAARQAGLTAAARETPDIASTKKTKGKLLDI